MFPGPNSGHCDVVSKGKVEIQEAVNGIMIDETQLPMTIFYRVVIDGSQTGFVLDSDLLANGTDKDPAVTAADCKRRGNPRVGMTVQQAVATCWGKPDTVNRTENAGGVFDQYVYEGRFSNRYLYFRNGVLTSIQTSQ
jgi:hypothetical protein